MALYTKKLDLAEAAMAPMVSDRPDGLWPTVVVDEYDRALGLCSNLESVAASVEVGMRHLLVPSPRPLDEGRVEREHAGAPPYRCGL